MTEGKNEPFPEGVMVVISAYFEAKSKNFLLYSGCGQSRMSFPFLTGLFYKLIYPAIPHIKQRSSFASDLKLQD